MEKEITGTDKSGEEITKNISYILQLIDRAKFMASSLSNFIYLKDFLKLNVSWDMTVKNVKNVEVNIGVATVFSNLKTLKMI